MRRLALLLLVLFLVNLPVVSQLTSERRLDRDGEQVVATVLAARSRDGHHYVDYRLPQRIDPRGTRYSAEVDAPTYEHARSADEISVRVVPGDPSNNRPAGVGHNPTFVVVAVLGDTVLLVVALLWWRRHRRWHRFELLDVAPGVATLRGGVGAVVAAAPEDWTARAVAGTSVSGGLHLVAEEDVVPGPPLTGLEQLHGVRYHARGRVADARRGWVVLELDEGFRLRVETGPHRIRADIRESTDVVGVLCFTPR